MGKKSNIIPCPCGHGDYTHCCAPLITHQALPDTAEQLMRSRYTAFVLQDADYLQYTWHPDTFPKEPLFDTNTQTKWLRLEVKHYQPIDATHATVEFIAHYKVQGRAQQLHEISRFTQIPDNNHTLHWVYVDGDFDQ